MDRFRWCESFVCLRGKPISFKGRPYLRAIYNSMARRIVLRCSRQVEKTTFICNVVVHTAVTIPGVHTHIGWEDTVKAYVPSPLLIDERLLAVKDMGVAVCFDARSGNKLWEQRLGQGEFSASPVECEGLVFVPNEAGRTFVFRAGRKFEMVAENGLGDGGFASPVIVGGQLFLRTLHRLYCIGHPEDVKR